MSNNFTPDDITNILHWYRSDLGVVIDENNRISEWKDQIGSANAAASGVRRPLLVEDSLNGYPYIRFNAGVTQHDQASTQALWANFSIPKPFSIMLVWQQWGWSGDGGPSGTGDNSRTMILGDTGGTVFQIENDAQVARWRAPDYITISDSLNNGFTVGQPNYGVTILTGETNSKVYNNGFLVASGSTPSTGPLGSIVTLCGRYSDYHDGAYCDIVEAAFFTGSLTSNEALKLTKYAAERYDFKSLR